jgi:hypothetical protein
MTGNHRPRAHMTMPPMVNMAAPFTPSQHYQPQFHFDPSTSRSGEPVTDNPAVFHFHPGMRNDHHPPAGQSAHSWLPSYQAMNSHPGQHGNMDLAAICHATASYNPETRTEQEAMLDAAIFLSVAESAICRATRASTPPECWGCHGIQDLNEHRLRLFKDCPQKTREDVKSGRIRSAPPPLSATPPMGGHGNQTPSPVPHPPRNHGTMGAATSYCRDRYWCWS